MNEADITDIEDPVEKMIPQNDDPFSPDLSLVIKPPTSEKFNDSENEKLQLQTIQKPNPSVIKQSLHFSICELAFHM